MNKHINLSACFTNLQNVLCETACRQSKKWVIHWNEVQIAQHVYSEWDRYYVNGHWPDCGDRWAIAQNRWRKYAGQVVCSSNSRLLYHYYKAWPNYIKANIYFDNCQIIDTADQSDNSICCAALMSFSGTGMVLTWKRTSWYSQHVLEATVERFSQE